MNRSKAYFPVNIDMGYRLSNIFVKVVVTMMLRSMLNVFFNTLQSNILCIDTSGGKEKAKKWTSMRFKTETTTSTTTTTTTRKRIDKVVNKQMKCSTTLVLFMVMHRKLRKKAPLHCIHFHIKSILLSMNICKRYFIPRRW